MLRSKSNWKYTETEGNLSEAIDDSTTSPILKKLLLQRGITTEDAANQFLSPDLKNLHNTARLSMIDKAGARVHQAIERGEKVLIFGDYDADGVSSTAVLFKTLLELGADCDFYIPNRFTEGYGPNEDAFRTAHERGFTLIITVDCGIASIHEAEVAKQLGIDLIITDHHEPQEKLPGAYAIIHPKCSPDYPFWELAGVGVAFKFAEYLLGYFPKHLLDLVAIGTIADLVPLIDENRILTFFGLHALTITKNEGLKALKQVCQIEGNVTEEDVGFSIGPRLNSVGRLDNASLAVHLLMTENPEEAADIAEEIDTLNNERKQIVKDIVKEAEQLTDPFGSNGVIVVAKEGWNEGVLGIVASKLVQKYDRPAIVLTIKPDTGVAKGSARSIPAFDIFKNCMVIREYFTHFGGHSQAAGMTLPLENIAHIRNHLTERINEQLTEDDFKQEIVIADKLSVSHINEQLIDAINQLAPFGMKNPKPIFMVKEIPFEARRIGSDRTHLKLQFKKENYRIEGIGFGFGHLQPHLSPGTKVSVVGELGINEWNGQKKVQIVVQDLAIDEWQLFDERGRKQVDISSFIDLHERHLVISNQIEPFHPKAKQITYESSIDELDETDVLYIYDLPDDLNRLKRIIQKTQPKNIHACYYVENSAYMKSFPNRDEFIWLYALIRKRQTLDLKQELEMIMNVKRWSKERVLFISRVFFELGFVKISNGVITASPNPNKRDLHDSRIYQQRLKQIEIEKILYYSNYEQLKNWFRQCMDHLETPEEEVIHGL